jgi:hypothetical protein
MVHRARQVLGQYLERCRNVHPRELVKATLRNRFRYWDLEERCAALHPMGFQSFACIA